MENMKGGAFGGLVFGTAGVIGAKASEHGKMPAYDANAYEQGSTGRIAAEAESAARNEVLGDGLSWDMRANGTVNNPVNNSANIVNIEGNKITEPPLLAAMMNGSSKPPAGDSVDNSIHQNTENGNTSGTKFKGLALQREYRQAVESGNMERAREILAEKAARRGYSPYDTTADAQNHIIQNANPVEDDIKIAETLNTTPVTEVNRRRGSVPATESIAPDGAKSNTFGFTPEQIAKVIL